MRVKKGDLVQMLSGKDRGKQGRVLEAHPRDERVIVENLNIARRHQKPQPIRDANRMGGTQMSPGGIISKPDSGARRQRHARLPTCKQPTRVGHATKQVKGQTVKVRLCKHEGCGQEID